MANAISYDIRNRIEYILDCSIDVENDDFSVFKLSNRTINNINRDFACLRGTRFVGYQSNKMRTTDYTGEPWGTRFIDDKAKLSKSIFGSQDYDHLINLVQVGLGKVYDDLMLTDYTYGTFGIYAVRNQKSELAGVFRGFKNGGKTDFEYAVNPYWQLSRAK